MAAPYARMEFKQREFNQKLARIVSELHKNASTYVLSKSRQLVKKWAFLAPKDTGRLRAGFWPAANALGITTGIYTSAPNRGEGIGVNNSGAKNNPSVTIWNSVPYVANAGGAGTWWWFHGLLEIEARAQRELEERVGRKTWNSVK